MAALPNLLSCFRLVLVPLLLTLAWSGCSRPFVGCLVVSLLTDGVDGFLARRFNAASRLGAKLDSWADFATFLALPFCGWWLRPDVLRAEAPFLITPICFYLAAVAFGLLKYRRLTSYHTWSSKALALLSGVVVLVFFLGGPGWPFRVLAPLAVLSLLEEIAITALLPVWQANIPSLWHARQINSRAGDRIACPRKLDHR
jgi:phosphatidylglycerophosphate synthase